MMNRQEKINLLKEVENGNLEQLNKLKTVKEYEDYICKWFIPCFHYVLANGWLTEPHYHVGELPLSLEDLDIIKESQYDFEKFKSYDILSDRFLYVYLHLYRSVELIIERQELHLLKPYLSK